MESIAPSALVVGILYFLSRWTFATVDYAAAHPGRGRPGVTWTVTWCLELLVSGASAASLHLWVLQGAAPRREVLLFDGLVFGGFFVGFLLSGFFDHRVRLRGG
jgi:hypothetical protein